MEELRVSERIRIPGSDLSWTASRASGAGGQNVNKVSSKVDLRFDLDGTRALRPEVKARLRRTPGVRFDADGRVIVTSQLTRDQPRNLDDARQKLVALIRQALVVPKRRRATKPTRASKRRRLDAKRRQKQKKEGRRRVDAD